MNIQALVNSTLASFAATVRTDMDRGVVSTALEMLEDLLKFLRPFSFPLQERVTDSLVVSVQDVFEKKVYYLCRLLFDQTGKQHWWRGGLFMLPHCKGLLLGLLYERRYIHCVIPLASLINFAFSLLLALVWWSLFDLSLSLYRLSVRERSMMMDCPEKMQW